MPNPNRELSQFGSFLYVDNISRNIGIATTSTPYVGIGTTNPVSKLDVSGDANVSGFVSATAYYINGDPLVSAAIQVWDTSGSDAFRLNGNVGIGTTIPTSKLDVSGDIKASGRVVSTGITASGSVSITGNTTITGDLTASGNVGIGSTIPTQKLQVIGNVSASRFISTTTTESPISVQSNALVTNLNADFFRGRTPPSGDFVGSTDTQTLINKTFTDSSTSFQDDVTNSKKMQFQLSGISASTTRTLTVPDLSGTIVVTGSVGVVTSGMILDGTITNSDISTPSPSSAGIAYNKLYFTTTAGAGITNTDIVSNASIAYSKLNLSNSILNSDLAGSIANNKLANSTISGISLGSNLNNLTAGSYVSYNSGTTYNGNTAKTISVNASTTGTDNVVARDSSGNFSAATITANLSGNVTGNLTGDVTGNLTGDVTGNLTGSVVGPVSIPTLHVRDQKTSGVDGGTFTRFSDVGWVTRTLNTTVTNTISGASLGANTITLPAGTYEIDGSAPAFDSGSHQCRFAGGAVIIYGTSEYSVTTYPSTTRSFVRGRFTILVSTTFNLQHACTSTNLGDGFGVAAGFTSSTEVYSDLIIRKIA